MTARSATISASIAVVAALAAPGQAPAQELWNGSRLGMTPDEVQTAFPKAAQGERTVDSDDVTLRVPDLRAGGHGATAFFDFAGGHLRTVELLLAPDRPGAAIDTGDVQTQLTAKYGPPVACEDDRASCEWRNGGVDITLIAARAATGVGAEILYGALAAPARTAPPTAPTPLALVRAFYGDLATGDGDQASQLVVPRKRARGAFSAQALTQFYSSLPRPIELVNAYPHGGGSVFVRYRFTAAGGRECDGDADVTTAWVGDRLLIDSIHSYSGC